MSSKWEQFEIEEKVIGILRDALTHAPDHHFGRPYMSAYQLAIEFAYRHPEVAQKWRFVGGKGIGVRNSLAQYLGKELSTRVHERQLPHVEGALWSDMHVRTLTFQHGGAVIESALAGSRMTLSLFRYVD